jgi:5'-nucleotidase
MLAALRLTTKHLFAALAILGMVCWGWAPAPALAAEVVAGTIVPKDLDNSEASAYGPEAAALRQLAEVPLAWEAPDALKTRGVMVKILAINDFHGQIGAGKKVSNRPVGSAPVLASYLQAAQLAYKGRTIIAEVGDFVGGSPPNSALLQDEPSISFFNLLGNRYAKLKFGPANNPGAQAKLGANPNQWNSLNNLVGVVGNHEFDEGKDELLRLLYGGNHAEGPFLKNPWKGADFPKLAANVVAKDTGKHILPPYVIKMVDGLPIGFVGAVLKDTPTIVTPSGVAMLDFLDEADAINAQVRKLKRQQVRAIVVLLHQGATQTSYNGLTDPGKNTLTNADALLNILDRLDDEVDVVLTGHAHGFTNALVNNANGKTFLVTQAWSAGTAYADVLLNIDPKNKDVMGKSAAIYTTWADAGPGLTPDPKVADLVAKADAKVAPIISEVVGTAAEINKTQNPPGESALGNLIADAQRRTMGTDFAFMNPGGIRADINLGETTPGDVTWGELYTVQPFNNDLVKMELTGQQIYDVLNQQWAGQPYARILQVSGLTYSWDNNLPDNNRIVEVRKDGAPIVRETVYTVTCNSFLRGGGDNFTVFKAGANAEVGPVDIDALVDYIKGLAQPFTAVIEGRITRLN